MEFVFSRLSNQRFVRSAYAHKFAYRSQRRRSIVAAKAHRFRLHPVFVFSRLSNQRFVRSAYAPVRSLTASQRRLTTVTAKAHRFRLHPVLFNLSSLPRAFALSGLRTPQNPPLGFCWRLNLYTPFQNS